MARKINLEAALITKEPEMVKAEWHYLFNDILLVTPDSITDKSSMQVYWKCPTCDNVYLMSPRDKVEDKERNQESCFYCRGRVQLHSFTVPL